MRILMMYPFIEMGGVAKHISVLSNQLIQNGHWIGIASAGGELMPEFLDAGITPFYLPLRPTNIFNLLLCVYKIVKLVRVEQIDILHSHHRFTTVIGSLVSLFTNVPLISTTHEFRQNWRPLARLWVGRKAIVPSEALKTHLSKLGIPPSQIIVIPNAINHAISLNYEKIAQLRQHPSLQVGKIIIGSIGRLSSEKGMHYFLKCIPLLQEKTRELSFVIIGDGPERSALENFTKDLGLDPTAIFLGESRHINEILEIIDIVVVPSVSESFSLVALEAMRASKPIVATDCGGITEVVMNMENGFIVQAKDHLAIANAISILVENPNLRTQFGIKGKELFYQRFSPTVMAQMVCDVYTSSV